MYMQKKSHPMKSKVCAILFSLALGHGATAFGGTVADVASAVRADAFATRINATNEINSLLASTSDANAKANLRLLKASVLLELAERELEGGAYDEATNLCASVVGDLQGDDGAWQPYGARFLMMGAHSLQGDAALSFAVATNALSELVAHPVGVDADVWNAISIRETASAMTIRDAFRTGVALHLALAGRTEDLTSCTNGLPENILELVERISRR